MWATILPAVIAALGSYMGYKSSSDAIAKRQAMAQRMQQVLDAYNNRAHGQVQQEVAKLAASNPKAQESAARKEYLDAIQKAQSTVHGSLSQSAPSQSGRYKKASKSASADLSKYGQGQASLNAGVQGVLNQRRYQSYDLADLGARVQFLQNLADLARRGYTTDIGLIQPNPFMQALGAGMQAYGYGKLASQAGNPHLNTVQPKLDVGHVGQIWG